MINLVCVLLDYFSKTFCLSVYYCGAVQYCMGYTDNRLALNYDGGKLMSKI